MLNFKKGISLFVALVFSLSAFFTKTVSAAVNFDIEIYDVQMEVSSEGVLHVQETLQVTFTEQSHGIYLDIPSVYRNKTITINDKTITKNFRFPISNIEVLSNQESKVTSENDSVRIRLGSENAYAPIHETYRIAYQIQLYDLTIEDFQYFLYNIISPDWQTAIKNATFSIQMPKAFPKSQLTVLSEDPNLSYHVEDTMILGSGSHLGLGKGITVQMILPVDYFQFPTSGWPTIALSALIVACLIASAWIYYRYGVDDELVTVVNFEAPYGMSPTMCSFIMHDYSTMTCAAYLLYWANKGYLTIEDTKKTLIFHKMKEMENGPEKRYFDILFKKGDTITSKQIGSRDVLGSIFAYEHDVFWKNKKLKMYDSKSFIRFTILMILFSLTVNGLLGYAFYFKEYDRALSFVVMGFGTVILALFISGLSYVIHISKKSLIVMMEILIGVYVGLFYYFTLSLKMNLIAHIILCTVVYVTCSYIASSLKVKKEYAKLYGEVLGFKEFIKYAEKDRLNALFEEHPTLFYDILPYAYAFSLTGVWAKHFKDMKLVEPEWYVGNTFTYYSFSRRMEKAFLNDAMPTQKSNRTSGGGFGGGISGGGFGGTTGGSW